jgi:DAK2 domain fusion protein YloV
LKVTTIDGEKWAEMIRAAGLYLAHRKAVVDSLNVFPVPDGDTGTNMSLTLQSAARDLDSVAPGERGHFGARAEAMARGALLGARGNSGVITSQILSGFATVCRGMPTVDGAVFVRALDAGVKAAYQAVMKPVRGTILTVSEAAAAGGQAALDRGSDDILEILTEAAAAALETLRLTPTMLPILKQAGVVDAGGQGFLYILEGFIASLRGEKPEEGESAAALAATPPGDIENMTVEDQLLDPWDITFGYCTEFVIKDKDNQLDLEKIRAYLSTLGDCVLVVGTPGICKVHVHTNEPGKALDFVTPMGSLHKLKIDNMREEAEKRERLEIRKIGLIAVSGGPGLDEVFRSLGVHKIVTGGQTMNPSTQDFVAAIKGLAAREIIILPNNSNIVLAAEQAAKVSGGIVHVVPTKTVPQGIGALLAFHEEGTGGENARRMGEAAKKMITLEITYAARDASYEEYEIKKGEILGLIDGKLALTAGEREECALALFERTLRPEHDLITIYYGQDITEAEADRLGERVAALYDWADIEIHGGGQPLYYYIISLE